MITAREIAEIVCGPGVSVERATKLIEQYGRIVANTALIKKNEEIISKLESDLKSSREKTNA